MVIGKKEGFCFSQYLAAGRWSDEQRDNLST
jgi:hypothetical protein